MILRGDGISRQHQLGATHVEALSHVSVTLERGDFLVVSGPSGAGKSTLLNLLSGFDQPTTGRVYFRDVDISTLTAREVAGLRSSSFGFIYQTPHLISDKTVKENVTLAFHYGAYIEQREALGRCEQILDYVGLTHLADRYPSTLSGGEMQRVVFARALVRRPDVIFADEPTGSLDSANSKRLLEMLRQQSEKGRVVIMVTHDSSAIAYGTRQLALAKSDGAG